MTGGIVLIDTIYSYDYNWNVVYSRDKPILISGLIIGLFGLADDYLHLSHLKKLLGNIWIDCF